MPYLTAGPGIYTRGMYVDCLVRDWASVMYVWGITFNVSEYANGILETDPCPDFCELSVVDLNGDGYVDWKDLQILTEWWLSEK